ncbi:MAG: hypothetical protein ABI282_01965 [Candidatus Baltobacteraceae bacterium]
MRKRAGIALCFVVLLGYAPESVSAAAFGPAPDAARSPDPYVVFAKARRFFEAQRYLPYLDYDVAVRVVEGGKERTERYASAYDATTGAIWIDTVSDYEIAHPASGRGVNFFGLNKPEPPVDFLGVPYIAPTYTFGIARLVPVQPPHTPSDAELVAEVREAFHDPNPRAASTPSPTPDTVDGLREIAAVTAYKRDYHIILAGEEIVNARQCYHLSLTPVRARDDRYRLRDAWIDEGTYATQRLREALNFKDGPGTSVPWTVDFAAVGNVYYIARERAERPMPYRGLIFDQATISFENIRPRKDPARPRDVPLTNGLIMEEPEP